MKLSWKGNVLVVLGVVFLFFVAWVFYEKRASERDQELGQRLRDCIISEIDFSGMNGLEAFQAFHEKIVEIDPWFESVNIRYDLEVSMIENQNVEAEWRNIPSRELLRELCGRDLVEHVLTGVSFTSRNGEIVIFDMKDGYREAFSSRCYTQIYLALWELDVSLSRLIYGDDTDPADPFGGGLSARLGLTDWM